MDNKAVNSHATEYCLATKRNCLLTRKTWMNHQSINYMVKRKTNATKSHIVWFIAYHWNDKSLEVELRLTEWEIAADMSNQSPNRKPHWAEWHLQAHRDAVSLLGAWAAWECGVMWYGTWRGGLQAPSQSGLFSKTLCSTKRRDQPDSVSELHIAMYCGHLRSSLRRTVQLNYPSTHTHLHSHTRGQSYNTFKWGYNSVLVTFIVILGQTWHPGHGLDTPDIIQSQQLTFLRETWGNHSEGSHSHGTQLSSPSFSTALRSISETEV